MSIHIKIYDGATPMLDKIAQLSHHSALAVLDQAGMEIRDKTRAAFKASKPSEWGVRIVDGKRVYSKGGVTHLFGKRLNFKKRGPDSMANMIDSYLMPGNMTMIVAGMHKRFLPRYYYQEAQSGSTSPIYGEAVGQVLQGSWQILQKLSKGGRFSSQTEKYKATRMGIDTKPMGKDPLYQFRPFIEEGRNAAMGTVQELMTTKLQSLIHKQVNRAAVQVKVRAS